MPILRPHVLGKLAKLHLGYGNLVEAKAVIDEAKKYPDQEYIFFQDVKLAEAELAARQEDERALILTSEVLTTLRQLGMRVFALDALMLQGELLLASGQIEEACDCWLEVFSTT